MTARIREAGFSAERFRWVMGQFASGVTVLTVKAGDEVRGMTANAFMSGSLSPPLCVISIAKRARTHVLVQKAKRFAVNVLSREQGDIAIQFAGRSSRRVPVVFDWIDGVPLLPDALAHMAANIVAEHDCGDHTLFVGQLFHI